MALEWHYYNEHSLNTGGIYCLRSKPKAPGFIRKTAWTVEAMAAGLQYVLVKEDSVVYNGELIAYHRLTPRSFAKKLQSLKEEAVNGIRIT